jgi:adenylate kinase
MEAKHLMDKGSLVPDSVVIGMIRHKLRTNPTAGGFIFDGFPRTIPQAEALDELLNESSSQINAMLALEVSEEELLKRLLERGKKSGRSDDQDESIISNRIREYNAKTAPLAGYYSKQGKLKAIAGIGSVDEIFDQLCDAIKRSVTD